MNLCPCMHRGAGLIPGIGHTARLRHRDPAKPGDGAHVWGWALVPASRAGSEVAEDGEGGESGGLLFPTRASAFCRSREASIWDSPRSCPGRHGECEGTGEPRSPNPSLQWSFPSAQAPQSEPVSPPPAQEGGDSRVQAGDCGGGNRVCTHGGQAAHRTGPLPSVFIPCIFSFRREFSSTRRS